MMESAYNLLHVEKNASPEEVRKAYVRLVRRYPPEHFPEKFTALRKAYQQLALSDDFLAEITEQICGSENALEAAACLWGDYRELAHEPHFAPEDLIPLLEGAEARSSLDELLELASATEIEWKTGGNG